METYFQINTLPRVAIDSNQVSAVLAGARRRHGHRDAQVPRQRAVDREPDDLLLSRTAFLNTTLAANVYGVAVPAGATTTTFVRTTLPADQRSGLLTNAGFLTVHAAPTGRACWCRAACSSPRCCSACRIRGPTRAGRSTRRRPRRSRSRCAPRSRPATAATSSSIRTASRSITTTTIGRYRTIDGWAGRSTRTPTLPAAIGGGAVANGVELAQKLATNPAFTNCMARSLLQYAMVDPATTVEVPLPAAAGGLRDRRRRPAVPERRRQDVHRSRARDGGGARVRAPEGRAMISYRFRRRAFLTAHERRRRPQDHAPHPGGLGAGDAIAGPAAGHALAGRDRGGVERCAVEADVGQRGRLARAQAVRRRAVSGPT